MKNIILKVKNIYKPIFSLNIENKLHEGFRINISQTEKRSCEKDEVRGATNINLNSKNTDKSQKENSINNTVEDNKFYKDLENYILTIVKDISATNMFDIMEGHVNATETITHIITVEPGTKPIKQKTRGIPQAFQAEFKRTIK